MKISEVILPNIIDFLSEDQDTNCWSEELTADQILAEVGLSSGNQTDSNQRETVFRRCDSYKETYFTKVRPYSAIRSKFRDFMELKRWNPTEPFGKSDKLFVGTGFFIKSVPNLKHAHITQDLSIVYKLDGGTIWLYGFYTHDDLGTGRSENRRIQDVMATKIANKTEADCPVGVTQPNPRYR